MARSHAEAAQRSGGVVGSHEHGSSSKDGTEERATVRRVMMPRHGPMRRLLHVAALALVLTTTGACIETGDALAAKTDVLVVSRANILNEGPNLTWVLRTLGY